MRNPLFSLKSVRCSFGHSTPVLEIERLDIERGAIVAILGESGAGKSTLLNLLGRLHPIDQNSDSDAYFYNPDNQPVNLADTSPGQHASFIFQNSYLFESASIRLNLDLMDIAPIDDEALASYLLRFGFDESAGRVSERVRNLSGGQKRRLALISALLRNRDTILADELTSDLDPIWAKRSLDILKEWQSEKADRTILWVTHHYEQALEYADHVLIVTPDGKISPINIDQEGVARPIEWPTRNLSELKSLISENSLAHGKTDTSIPAKASDHSTTEVMSYTGNYKRDLLSSILLAGMTSYHPEKTSGHQNLWAKIKDITRSIRIISQIVILTTIMVLSTLAFSVWDYVGADVERQKQDPQTQHFVIVQNMRAQNTRLDKGELGKLNIKLQDTLKENSANPFSACENDSFEQSAKERDLVFGRIEQSEYVLLHPDGVSNPLTRRARLLILHPTDPLLSCMRIRTSNGLVSEDRLGELLKYPDEMRIALSQSFLEQVFLPNAPSDAKRNMKLQFAKGLSPKGPSFDIVGSLESTPYNDRFAVDGITTTEIYAAWRSTNGDRPIKDFDSASVYFSEDTAAKTILAMKDKNYVFNIEAYTKFTSVIELRNVIESGFRVFALIVAFSIFSTIAFLAWLFLTRFSKPIGILHAHDRPTSLVLITFITQLIISALISTILSVLIICSLQFFTQEIGNLIGFRQFILSFTVVLIGAIIGAILSFVVWRRSNPYAMQLLR